MASPPPPPPTLDESTGPDSVEHILMGSDSMQANLSGSRGLGVLVWGGVSGYCRNNGSTAHFGTGTPSLGRPLENLGAD